jgi:hypothetical protein
VLSKQFPLMMKSCIVYCYFAESVHGAARDKRTVVCDVCGRMLSDASALSRHKKTHSGVKPHQCPFCEKRFRQK